MDVKNYYYDLWPYRQLYTVIIVGCKQIKKVGVKNKNEIRESV